MRLEHWRLAEAPASNSLKLNQEPDPEQPHGWAASGQAGLDKAAGAQKPAAEAERFQEQDAARDDQGHWRCVLAGPAKAAVDPWERIDRAEAPAAKAARVWRHCDSPDQGPAADSRTARAADESPRHRWLKADEAA